MSFKKIKISDVELDSDGVILRSQSLILNIKLKESFKAQTFAKFEQKLTQEVIKKFLF